VSAKHLFLANVNSDLPPDLLVTGKIPGSCVCHWRLLMGNCCQYYLLHIISFWFLI